MIDVDEALDSIARVVDPLPPTTVKLVQSVGHCLADELVSQIDSPPFSKSMMDGIALRWDEWQGGRREFPIVGTLTAGATPRESLPPGAAFEIMTGAAIPQAADLVVPVEQLDQRTAGGAHRAVIKPSATFRRGQNVLAQGAILRRGVTVLERGHVLAAHDVGLLAEMGLEAIDVIARPTLATVTTGDELVPVGATRTGAQIYNTNGPLVLALARQLGIAATDLGIVPDDRGALAERLGAGLESDVLVVTGGVSAGIADLVPSVLEELGVERVFHKVNIKPGKPIWFGVRRKGRRSIVFGLPGNPVSTLVTFRVFVRRAIELASGLRDATPTIEARLAQSRRYASDRTTYWPARLDEAGGELVVRLLDWKGSADLRTVCQCNSLVRLTAGERELEAGASVEVVRL